MTVEPISPQDEPPLFTANNDNDFFARLGSSLTRRRAGEIHWDQKREAKLFKMSCCLRFSLYAPPAVEERLGVA